MDGFSSDLFVERKELDELIGWIKAKEVRHRLRNVAAPPGCGKSWLLCELVERLSNSKELFLIYVPPPSVEQQPHPALPLRSRDTISQWLPSIIDEAKKVCLAVRDGYQNGAIEYVITHLLDDLCNNCSPALRPILIVDGFDELLPNEREEIEKHLLQQFWREQRVRVILAFRDELSVSISTLRRGANRILLDPFDEAKGQAQLLKLATADDQSSLSPQEINSLILPYSWTHPYINTFLYKVAQQRKQNGQTPLFTANDLRYSWVSLIEEKLEQETMSLASFEDNLIAIACHSEDTWTIETFARVCNCSIGEAYTHINRLQTLSLVSIEKTRYQVVAGVREIIRAEAVLRRGQKP